MNRCERMPARLFIGAIKIAQFRSSRKRRKRFEQDNNIEISSIFFNYTKQELYSLNLDLMLDSIIYFRSVIIRRSSFHVKRIACSNFFSYSH